MSLNLHLVNAARLWLTHYPLVPVAAATISLVALPILARSVGRVRACWITFGPLSLVLLCTAIALNNEYICILTSRDAAQFDLESIRHCIDLYENENGGEHPRDLQELVDRRYLKNYTSPPRDPWGNEYMYEQRGSSSRAYSYGADGKPGGKGEAEDVEVVVNQTK